MPAVGFVRVLAPCAALAVAEVLDGVPLGMLRHAENTRGSGGMRGRPNSIPVMLA